MTASTDLGDTLANIRARAEAATEGPWHIGGDPSGYEAVRSPRRDHVADCRYAEDAEFIAHAPADIELLLTLLDQVTTQRDEIQANRDALAHKVAEQRAVIARVRDFATELRESTASGHPSCAYDEDCAGCAADTLDAALDGADTTTTDGSKA